MDDPSRQLLREAEECSAKKSKKRKRKRQHDSHVDQSPEDLMQSSKEILNLQEKNKTSPRARGSRQKRNNCINDRDMKEETLHSGTKQPEAIPSNFNGIKKSQKKGEKNASTQSSVGSKESTQANHLVTNSHSKLLYTTEKEGQKTSKGKEKHKRGEKLPITKPKNPEKAVKVCLISRKCASLSESQQTRELAFKKGVASQEGNDNLTLLEMKSPEFEACITKNEKEKKKSPDLALKPKIGQGPIKSPYFQNVPQKSAISCIPFPPLSASRFGLVQERLADSPFKLLVAVALLNKTRGSQAIPIYEMLMKIYPTPRSLAAAKVDEVADHIRCLGLQNSRAKRFVAFAKSWVQDPPIHGRRHRILHYPNVGDGLAIKKSEILDDDDDRSGAWEIAHLPGVGAYALDSWRIFCRDRLRRLATGWNGEGADPGFEPEWKRVIPKDKELQAFIRWSWLRLDIVFDTDTGEKRQASENETSFLVNGGVWEI